MGNEDSSPKTDYDRYTGRNRRHNADNHDGMLLSRRVSIDNHRGRRVSFCKAISESKKRSREIHRTGSQTLIAEET